MMQEIGGKAGAARHRLQADNLTIMITASGPRTGAGLKREERRSDRLDDKVNTWPMQGMLFGMFFQYTNGDEAGKPFSAGTRCFIVMAILPSN